GGAVLLMPLLLVPSAQAYSPPIASLSANSPQAMPSAKSGFAMLLAPIPSEQPVSEDSVPEPVDVQPPPQPATQTPHMIRWVYMLGGEVPEAVRQHPENVDVISPGWFHLNAVGDVYGHDVPQVTRWAHQHGIKVMPIVDNDEFD